MVRENPEERMNDSELRVKVLEALADRMGVDVKFLLDLYIRRKIEERAPMRSVGFGMFVPCTPRLGLAAINSEETRERIRRVGKDIIDDE